MDNVNTEIVATKMVDIVISLTYMVDNAIYRYRYYIR